MNDDTILEKLVSAATEFYTVVGELKKASDKACEQFLKYGTSNKTLVHCGECAYARERTEEFGLGGNPLYECAYSKMPNAAWEYCSWGVERNGDNPRR